MRVIGAAIAVAVLTVAASAQQFSASDRRQLLDEWSKKTGYARRDLNNVQILSDFRMSIQSDPSDTIVQGTQIRVREVDIDDDRRSLDLDVQQVGSKRWTEVHLILPKPFGAMPAADQMAQLNAMWMRLVAEDAAAARTAGSDTPADGAVPAGATVHIYRPGRQKGKLIKHAVNCDGLDIADLANGHYITLRLQPGSHEFYLIRPSFKRLSLSVEANREYYLSDEISLLTGAYLEETTVTEATPAMKKLQYAESQHIWDRVNVEPNKK